MDNNRPRPVIAPVFETIDRSGVRVAVTIESTTTTETLVIRDTATGAAVFALYTAHVSRAIVETVLDRVDAGAVMFRIYEGA